MRDGLRWGNANASLKLSPALMATLMDSPSDLAGVTRERNQR